MCCFTMDPKPAEPSKQGLKLLKLWAKTNVPLFELVVSGVLYSTGKLTNVYHTVNAESNTAFYPCINLNQAEKEKSNNVTNLPDELLGCWLTLSNVILCLTVLSSMFFDSPSIQWLRGFQVLKQNGTTIICPWVDKAPESHDARSLRLLLEEGWQCWVPSITGQWPHQGGRIFLFSVIQGLCLLCVCAHHTSIIVLVKSLSSCSSCSKSHQLLTPLLVRL